MNYRYSRTLKKSYVHFSCTVNFGDHLKEAFKQFFFPPLFSPSAQKQTNEQARGTEP